MNKEDKLQKICNDFSLLNEKQQDYILGILQALVFAEISHNTPTAENTNNNS
jgi:hypothetical protein